MIIKNSCIFLVFALIAFSISAEIYKWVDEEGKVHYGEKPPQTENTDIKTIKIRDNVDTKSSSDALKEKTNKLNEKNKNRKKEKADQKLAKEELKKNEALCEKAKKNLANYQNPRVNIEQKDGTMKTLGEEERQSGIIEAKDIVKRACNY